MVNEDKKATRIIRNAKTQLHMVAIVKAIFVDITSECC